MLPRQTPASPCQTTFSIILKEILKTNAYKELKLAQSAHALCARVLSIAGQEGIDVPTYDAL